MGVFSLNYWGSNMAIPDHLFHWCPMGFREEEFSCAEINIKAGIYEVPPVYASYMYAYRMFHTTHSEPSHKAGVICAPQSLYRQ